MTFLPACFFVFLYTMATLPGFSAIVHSRNFGDSFGMTAAVEASR